ncbi:hypothetical protein [Enterovirga rhinocerotis]|uniref:Lipoprotein n=1 Tax=Enterovirga rhinocerotis TaxID=1339210 RepID=A0A4V3DXW8_9HYPH|nr:hypothetical protein [Enterovirga rhinocerotis]TDR90119.1 hypothetical protein EV668_2961 [Enterovirga rhinocerotis]
MSERRGGVGFAAMLAAALGASGAAAQTCAWMPRPVAEDAVRYLAPGTEVQGYCAPCRDRQAVKATVQRTEIRPIDTYNHQVLINGQATDIAYLYVLDPRRKRWRNLGLIIRCHEEDDVPPTLPANRVAP